MANNLLSRIAAMRQQSDYMVGLPMRSLDARLLALEQHNRVSLPALLLLYLCEQEGIPTPEQAAQIAQAEKQGQPVNVIRFVCAENSLPGFSRLTLEQ